MASDTPTYADLPRLRAELEAHSAAGRTAEAREARSLINRLTVEAKRAAAPIVDERTRARDAYRDIVEQIRELQGSVAQVAGGHEGRQARIRELALEARRIKARHAELNERVAEFRRLLESTTDR